MSHYPSVPDHSYSLIRLKKALECRESLPDTIWVGGRVILVEGSKCFLEGQGWRLEAQGVFDPSIHVGDHVLIKVHPQAVQFVGGQVLKAGTLESQVMTKPQVEPKGLGDKIFVHREWQRFLSSVKDYFLQLGFAEVNTPYLVPCPGMEVQLEPFATEWRFGAKLRRLFLPTSPEIHLKKLLSRGYSDVFEIKTCFRNEELSPLHQPEFFMLEWYRAFSDLNQIAEDLKGLLHHLSAKGLVKSPWKNIQTVSMRELFLRHLNIELHPQTSYSELAEKAEALGLPIEGYDWDDIFHLLFISKVEPQLPFDTILFVRDFPPSQAALSRLKPDGWADRMEMFWQGMEIANGFHELNDPDEQLQRWEGELELRKQKNKTLVPIDEEFIAALRSGLPPSGGIALGLERLFMCCQGVTDISDLRFFSWGKD